MCRLAGIWLVSGEWGMVGGSDGLSSALMGVEDKGREWCDNNDTCRMVSWGCIGRAPNPHHRSWIAVRSAAPRYPFLSA